MSDLTLRQHLEVIGEAVIDLDDLIPKDEFHLGSLVFKIEQRAGDALLKWERVLECIRQAELSIHSDGDAKAILQQILAEQT